MAKDKTDAPAVYIANDTFYFDGSQLVLAGHTVEAGHPLLKGREHLFRPFEPTWPKPTKADKPTAAPSAKPDALAERQALVARAKELGIPAKGKSAELEAAIAEAEAAAAAAAAAATQPNPDADNGEPEPDEDD